MEKRVVITGIGAVTPVGNDIPTTWESLLAGKNGIGKITKFDTSNSKVNIAAEVKGFDPLLYIEKSQVRKMDLFTQYAMAAAAQAMQDSGIEGKVEPERLGRLYRHGRRRNEYLCGRDHETAQQRAEGDFALLHHQIDYQYCRRQCCD